MSARFLNANYYARILRIITPSGQYKNSENCTTTTHFDSMCGRMRARKFIFSSSVYVILKLDSFAIWFIPVWIFEWIFGRMSIFVRFDVKVYDFDRVKRACMNWNYKLNRSQSIYLYKLENGFISASLLIRIMRRRKKKKTIFYGREICENKNSNSICESKMFLQNRWHERENFDCKYYRCFVISSYWFTDVYFDCIVWGKIDFSSVYRLMLMPSILTQHHVMNISMANFSMTPISHIFNSTWQENYSTSSSAQIAQLVHIHLSLDMLARPLRIRKSIQSCCALIYLKCT